MNKNAGTRQGPTLVPGAAVGSTIAAHSPPFQSSNTSRWSSERLGRALAQVANARLDDAKGHGEK